MQNDQSAEVVSSVLDSIVSGEQIPALQAGVPQLLKKLSQDDVELTELSNAIAEFPSISSRLLFLANSAWSAPVVPIDNIQLACSKLGLSVIRSVSIALSIATPFNPLLCKTFEPYRYWLNALMVGDITRSLASEIEAIPESQTATLQTAGILHNIGLLWLADRLPSETARALSDYLSNPLVSLDHHLSNHCNFGYCAVNGKLASAWNFPPLLHNAIQYHNSPEFNGDFYQQTHTIGLATAICEHLLIEDSQAKEFTDSRTALLGLSDNAIFRVMTHGATRKERFEQVIKVFMQSS